MKKVTILAFDDAVSATIAGPMDVFHITGAIWNRLHGMKPIHLFEVEAVSLTGDPVRCINGLSICVNGAMADVKKTDLIIISALLNIEENLKKYEAVIPWLIEQYEKGAQIAAVCMGTFILAKTGLLDGKIATTHWGMADKFKELFPRVDLRPERLFTDANSLYCSGAYSSSIDLSIYIVEKFFGREVAVQTAKVLVHDIGRVSQAPYTTFNYQRNHNDEAILTLQRMMETQYVEHLDMGNIAEDHGMGRRTFERRFKAATGDTPLFYLQRVRVEKAKKMLESEMKSLDEISFAVGYEDSGFFKKVFAKHTGLKPAEYRSKFQRVMGFRA
jgi:transcriptional regulator GlxA family with amidase domain